MGILVHFWDSLARLGAHYLWAGLWFATTPLRTLWGILAMIVIVLSFGLWWRHKRPFGRRKTLPIDRPAVLNNRLFWRLRPSHGHASMWDLWRYWGRYAMFRQSKRLRPAVPSWRIRLLHPHLYAIKVGHAQFFYRIWVNIVDQILVFAPPQTLKTVWLAKALMYYPGPALVTSKKGDLCRWTSGMRALFGPIATFNPQGLGRIPSTIAWNLIRGCQDYAVAERRADAFTGTVKMGDVQNGSFFSDQARFLMRGLFHAAGLIHGDLRVVVNWFSTGNTEVPEMILRAYAGPNGGPASMLADALHSMNGPAATSNSVIKSVMRECLGFMANPRLATAVLPDGDGFNPQEFLLGHGTLYMIADTHDEKSSTAPLFACLANEMHYTAVQLAEHAESDGHRMDPPFLMALDEVTQICPVPLPVWLADSGSRAVQIIVIAHSRSQLADRWDDNGADTIRDTCAVKILMPGITDTATLDMAREVCGKIGYREKGKEGFTQHERMSTDMTHYLPKYRGLIINRNRPPVVAFLARYYKDRGYKSLKRANRLMAPLEAAKTKSLSGPDYAGEVNAFLAALGYPTRAIEPDAMIPPGIDVDWDEESEQQPARLWRRNYK